MKRRGGTRLLDDTDRRLCEVLGTDPRMSNRALASAVGVTDETVAVRLRRLREQGVLATTVLVDWEAAGYTTQAMVRVEVVGRTFRDTVRPILDHPLTLAVTETSGPCDGIVTAIACSVSDLHRFVTRLHALPGVGRTRVDLIVGDVKRPPSILTLPIPPWDPDELPAPSVPLDDLDRALIRELTLDGHESNSELARRLGVSDATVRRRIQRLEDAGLITVVAAIDPVATGDLPAVAMAFCHTQGPLDPFVEAIEAEATVLAAYASLGTSTVILLLGAPRDAELQDFACGRLRRLPGLVATELVVTNEVLVHRSHLARVRQRD